MAATENTRGFLESLTLEQAQKAAREYQPSREEIADNQRSNYLGARALEAWEPTLSQILSQQ